MQMRMLAFPNAKIFPRIERVIEKKFMRFEKFMRAMTGAYLCASAAGASAMEVNYGDFANLSGLRLNERAAER